MRMNRVILALIAWIGTSGSVGVSQTPPPKTPPPARPAAVASRPEIYANLAQLMRGTLYPASNIIFAAQGDNPADVPMAQDPSVAVNLLASSYGKWQAVENSSLAIFEVANLLTIPGRKCSNGRLAPINNRIRPNLLRFRDAAMVAYKAAQSKNQDNILMAADTLTTACANCHNVYREKPTFADRCK